MDTISQVVNEKKIEVFETNNIFPSQKSAENLNAATSPSIDDTPIDTSILRTVSKETSSSTTRESFTSNILLKETKNIRSFDDLLDALNIPSRSPSKRSSISSTTSIQTRTVSPTEPTTERSSAPPITATTPLSPVSSQNPVVPSESTSTPLSIVLPQNSLSTSKTSSVTSTKALSSPQLVSTVAAVKSEPPVAPKTLSELNKIEFFQNLENGEYSEIKVKIRTIEELLDSSSDLDFPSPSPSPVPTTTPPNATPEKVILVKPTVLPKPVFTSESGALSESKTLPEPTIPQATPSTSATISTTTSKSASTPTSTSTPISTKTSKSRPISLISTHTSVSKPVTKSRPTSIALPVKISQPVPLTPPLPSSAPERPTAPKRKMSGTRINSFDNKNGTSMDYSTTSKASSNDCKSSPSTCSSAANSIILNDDRTKSVSPTPTTATAITTSGLISTNHYERLIEELKCPGCASPMKAPIKLCATGHSICQNCTVVLLMCPLCTQPFIDLRSRTLEALCSKAHFRCSNAAAGCTVRMQIDLLNWHEKQCVWKSMKCFMGRVWGDCTWTGREAGWKDHLESAHSDKVFTTDKAELQWDLRGRQHALAGYYVFEVFDEMFNFYQVYDRDRILFTMTITSTVRDRKQNFAYEVEMFHKDNEALVITQRFPVHSEYDKDILLDGTCVSVALTDLARLIGTTKILHFRVRIYEMKSPSRGLPPKKPSRKLPIDFQKTDIEGANLKSVPAGVIVTRQADDIPLDTSHIIDNDAEKDFMKYEETSSSEDEEFKAFVEKKWGTPQMNFNRKYLRSSLSKESDSSSGSSILSDGQINGIQRPTSETASTKSRMKSVTSTLRKSFRSLKTDIIDFKKPFAKKSPEKKESLIKE